MSLVGGVGAIPSGDREATQTGAPTRRSSQRNGTVGSDSSASTIAANLDGTRSRSNTNPDNRNLDHNKETVTSKHEASSTQTREQEVHQLARTFTQQSTRSTAGHNPFQAAPGSSLDPNGEHFNARAWCKAMLQMHTEDQHAHPLRTVGLSFSNLNVHGFGSATDYQKSVGNVWLDVVGLARKAMGQRSTKIDILQSVDGLVEAGEMLVVLGPPGSGCSTFLKTISGETHGFFVDKSSNLNFQGRYLLMVTKASC
jgi:ATP-binding cassette subfamily G (WHITE) protein 2 (PDR)